MKIEIFGAGCAKCKTTEKMFEKRSRNLEFK